MDFRDTLEKHKELVNAALEGYLEKKAKKAENLDEVNKKVYEAIIDLSLRGGKRLRPAALIEAYLGYGGKEKQKIVDASICVELFHNSTLAHDDIMDEAETRRGKPSFHKIMEDWYRGEKNKKHFGESTAILGGNILVSLGEDVLLNSGFDKKTVAEALKYYVENFTLLNEGQLSDVMFESRKNVSEKEYLRMVEGKTGTLFKTSVNIGATLAQADDAGKKQLAEYALKAAVAFQIQDDLLDLLADPEKLGKPRGGDLREGKRTLAVIKSLEKNDELLKYLGKNDASDREISEALRIMENNGAIQYAKDTCTKLVQESLKHLEKSGLAEENREFFKGFADYLVNREY